MIISHKYKFIFIKTAKVAGTSLELALRPFLGDDDISTPVVQYDEDFAAKNNIPGPVNFSDCFYPFRNSVNRKGFLHEHSWAYEIRGIVGDQIWEKYYTFSIERDPIEKIVSNYYHYKSKQNKLSYIKGLVVYLTFLKNKYNKSYLRNFNRPMICRCCKLLDWIYIESFCAHSQNFLRYSIDDNIVVDKVYSYEHLDELLRNLEGLIGNNIVMPYTKNKFRKVKKKFNVAFLDPIVHQRILTHKIFSKEIDILNEIDKKLG